MAITAQLLHTDRTEGARGEDVAKGRAPSRQRRGSCSPRVPSRQRRCPRCMSGAVERDLAIAGIVTG